MDGSGQVRIKGNGNLKGSQSYPVQFLYSNLLFSICLDHLALCIRSSRNRTLPDLHQKNVILFAPGHQTMGIYTASFPSSSPSKLWKVIIKIEDPTHEPFAHPCSWPHQTKHQELSHISVRTRGRTACGKGVAISRKYLNSCPKYGQHSLSFWLQSWAPVSDSN